MTKSGGDRRVAFRLRRQAQRGVEPARQCSLGAGFCPPLIVTPKEKGAVGAHQSGDQIREA